MNSNLGTSFPSSTLTVSAVRNVFQKAIDENLGDLNMTAVVKLFDNEH